MQTGELLQMLQNDDKNVTAFVCALLSPVK